MNRENLAKLAKHLWYNVNQEEFDMGRYTEDYDIKDGENFTKIEVIAEGVCGCVLGHSSTIFEKSAMCDWLDYSEKTFGLVSRLPYTDWLWGWCFSPFWASYDNSPRGAAKRIIYLLLGNRIHNSILRDGKYSTLVDLYDDLTIEDLPIN